MFLLFDWVVISLSFALVTRAAAEQQVTTWLFTTFDTSISGMTAVRRSDPTATFSDLRLSGGQVLLP
jgi:hypothetical protein